MSQGLENRGKEVKVPFDYARAMRMSVFGFFATGPLFHYWYHLLDSSFPKKVMTHVVLKAGLDQLICAPIFDAFFFMGMGTLEGKSWQQIKDKLRQDWLKTYLVDCAVWPLSDFVQRTDSTSQQLGKVLSSHKLYSIYPFAYLNSLPVDAVLGRDLTALIETTEVKQPIEYAQDTMVMNKSKKVLGTVDNVVTGRGVITKITTTKVDVNWYYYIDDSADPPPNMSKPSDLILFKDAYDFAIIGESVTFQNNEGQDEGGLIFLTKTRYKVSWQDGTTSDESSVNLVNVDSLATDFFPGDVVEPAEIEDKIKWGVIKEYHPEKRTCSIYWNNNDTGEIEVENDVSVYSIEYLEDYNFDQSDFVFKSENDKIMEQADVIGQVIGHDKCKLLVRWNNDFEEYVYPSELCIVEDEEEDEPEVDESLQDISGDEEDQSDGDDDESGEDSSTEEIAPKTTAVEKATGLLNDMLRFFNLKSDDPKVEEKKENEVWQAGFSNLLQVLISIQGLILGCKEPYFLEAGYESQIGTKIGLRNSSLYNEEVYLLTLEALLFYYNNKPTAFKDIIGSHLLEKRDDILHRVNQFFSTQHTSIFGITLPPNEGFVKPLKALKAKLESLTASPKIEAVTNQSVDDNNNNDRQTATNNDQ
eukprot:gene4342-5070_t